MIYIRTAWEDYFTGTPTLIQKSEYGERQTPSDSSVHVLNCLFKYITSSSNGGALSCTSVIYFLVESSSFFSCKTSAAYGAIYFSNNNGQCVLYYVCGYDCCTTNSNSYQFAYTYVKSDTSSKNYVNYSSIARCVNTNAYYTLYLNQGKICCPSVNISLNRCIRRSAIRCTPVSDTNSFTCSLSHSSFADNNDLEYICIQLCYSGANFEI
jgi:hypothetical protein